MKINPEVLDAFHKVFNAHNKGDGSLVTELHTAARTVLKAVDDQTKPKHLFEVKVLDPALVSRVLTSERVIATSVGQALDTKAPDPAEGAVFEVRVLATNVSNA